MWYGGHEKAWGRWDGWAGGLQKAARVVSLNTRPISRSVSVCLSHPKTHTTGRWRPRFSSQLDISILGKERGTITHSAGPTLLAYCTSRPPKYSITDCAVS